MALSPERRSEPQPLKFIENKKWVAVSSSYDPSAIRHMSDSVYKSDFRQIIDRRKSLQYS